MEQWKLAAVTGAVALGGVAVGGWMFGTDSAWAQQRPFSECFIARQETVDTNDSGEIQAHGPDRTVRVPPGFTVVGGGGGQIGNWSSAIVLCR
ncbi:MAG: hypothetical protein J0L92_06315 [Deltaproteobacteria bacterium]|nr:hypothetical protein [Deltaproteobacteria bacterium]